jgi:hypothetical protein
MSRGMGLSWKEKREEREEFSEEDRTVSAEKVSDLRASFLQERRPVDDERDGCRRGLLRERVHEKALAVGRDIVHGALVAKCVTRLRSFDPPPTRATPSMCFCATTGRTN